MAELTMREALNQALDEEMARDKSVILLGEEVAEYNGPYKVSKGLLDKYGADRVIDTPITELGFTGVAVGMAMNGQRPIVEWMTMQFGLLAIDQIINNAAKMHYMSAGELSTPMVIRGPNGYAEYLAGQHSQSFSSYFVYCPGIIVVAPSTPADAKGLLKSAIRSNDIVVFLESELTYGYNGDVPEGEHIVPLGKADVKKIGKDVTLISFSKPVLACLKAAEALAKEGISAEVVDLRTVSPFDRELVFDSVRKTNHVVVVDEGWPKASTGSWLQAEISYNCFDYLDAPVELVCLEDVPMPYNHNMELAVIPTPEKIVAAAKKTLNLV